MASWSRSLAQVMASKLDSPQQWQKRTDARVASDAIIFDKGPSRARARTLQKCTSVYKSTHFKNPQYKSFDRSTIFGLPKICQRGPGSGPARLESRPGTRPTRHTYKKARTVDVLAARTPTAGGSGRESEDKEDLHFTSHGQQRRSARKGNPDEDQGAKQ